MKKILIVLMLALVLMVTFASVAMAAEGDEPDTSGFYTWGMLATYAGCLAATIIITQFVKPVWPQKIATQFLCYIIALVLLIFANLFLKTLSWETAGISVLNAVVIALAANGAYNNIVAVVKPSI